MARDYGKQNISNMGGFVHDFGYASFTTTGTTMELDTLLTKIVGVSLTPAETMADAESLFINETNADGGIVVDADGQVTIGRVLETGGTATSDLEFYYHFIGID